MRKLMVVIAVLAQIAVLATMVYGRESVVQKGERVLLRTAPIDPRDPFRGDYVRLQYAMNSTTAVETRWSPSDYKPKKGDRVYAVLRRQAVSHTVYEAELITNVKPSSGQFIRGRITSRFNSLFGINNNGNRAGQRVKFGIEQMFVEQDTGFEIEAIQGVRGGLQVPMEVEVALSSEGVGVLTGYQWSPLGIEMVLQQNALAVPNRDENSNLESSNQDGQDDIENLRAELLEGDAQPTELNEQPSTLTIRLMNTSDKPVTINNPGMDCAFVLVPADISNPYGQEDDALCNTVLEPKPLTLAVGESYSIGVNLSDPRWFVSNNEQPPTDLRLVDDNAMYRIVYRTPSNTPIDGQNAYWFGEIPSQAFNGRGRID